MNLPQTLPPMLASAAAPFDAPDYFFEVKWDGWRCIAFLDGTTRLQSRNLRDLNPHFPELLNLHQAAAHPGMVVDGEIVIFHAGKPSFIRLQQRTRHCPTANFSVQNPAVFIAFDLLYLKGVSLMNQPLEERRSLLERHVHPSDALQLSETVAGQGIAFFEACRGMGLEGIVGKKRSSLYYPGKRTPNWKKCKAIQRALFTICGYTTARPDAQQLNALALAAKVDETWGFFGLVGTGITAQTSEKLYRLLQPLKTAFPPPFSWPVGRLPRIHWVQPVLVAEVEYLEMTSEFKLRHPVWRGLQPEKQPEQCPVI